MSFESVTELNRRFAIAGVAQVVAGNGGLAKIVITTPHGAGEMYLHGAQVTSWKPAGEQDVLFVSSHSLWQDGVAIRGGVPICFPWFGDKADDPRAPAHGFVRTKTWWLASIQQTGDAVTVNMFTASDDDTRKCWPADFRLLHRATFGDELTLELVVKNTGAAALRFEEALHAYHRVGDVTQVLVNGLDGTRYLDKTDGYREKEQVGDITITAETDRVYLATEHPVTVVDPVLQRRIDVTKENSRTTVVWNPWEAKGNAMRDLDANQWKEMLCIETSNVGAAGIELAPGEEHTMRATVRVTRDAKPS